VQESDAYVLLNRVEGLGPVKVRSLVSVLGSAAAIPEAGKSDLLQAPGIGEKLADKLLYRLQGLDADQEREAADRLGVQILSYADPAYPKALKEIHDPPLALYIKGSLLPADVHALGVVGSRRCTHYGTQVADRLSFQLAKQGYTVVSGLARGIDAAAHEGSLKGQGRTLAVMGTGIDQIYPSEHQKLAEQISEQGALITEFPIGFKPNRQSFPQRNRIISGLSKGILVVEAARGSGAMLTVDEANAQGRLVFAVPGRIDNPSAGGCNHLIKQGAKLVEDVDDILEEFEYLISPTPQGREDPEHVKPQVQLSEEEHKLLEFLGKREWGQDELIRESGLSASKIATLLLMLEMKRQVQSLPGRQVRRI